MKINWIQEGDAHPNGFSIKTGEFRSASKYMHTEQALYSTNGFGYVGKGGSELATLILHNFEPDPSTVADGKWIAFIFKLGHFQLYYRLRSWAPSIFKINFK